MAGAVGSRNGDTGKGLGPPVTCLSPVGDAMMTTMELAGLRRTGTVADYKDQRDENTENEGLNRTVTLRTAHITSNYSQHASLSTTPP